MFYKVKEVYPKSNYKLLVRFSIGETKIYDCNRLFELNNIFNDLKKNDLFNKVKVDDHGYGISWNESIDLSCDDLYLYGEKVDTPFDGLIDMKDATDIWDVNESTFRKAIQYGKLVVGKDCMKYGKQWVVSLNSLITLYGQPKI